MSYDAVQTDSAFLVYWRSTPTRAEVHALARELTAARRAAKEPLALFVVIPADRVDMPPPDARAAFHATSRDSFDQCRSIDVILLGHGVGVSLMRAGLRAMSVVTRSGHRVSVHAGVEDAIAERRPPPAVIAMLRQRARAA